MTAAVRRWPPALRVGSVVALFTVFAVAFLTMWVQEREAETENLRLYEQCLNSAQDVSQVKECTTGYYVRRDGRTGGDDPLQIARAEQRLEQLRVSAAGGVPDLTGTGLDTPLTQPVAPGGSEVEQDSSTSSTTTGPDGTPKPERTPAEGNGQGTSNATSGTPQNPTPKPMPTNASRPTDAGKPTEAGKPTDAGRPADKARTTDAGGQGGTGEQSGTGEQGGTPAPDVPTPAPTAG